MIVLITWRCKTCWNINADDVLYDIRRDRSLGLLTLVVFRWVGIAFASRALFCGGGARLFVRLDPLARLELSSNNSAGRVPPVLIEVGWRDCVHWRHNLQISVRHTCISVSLDLQILGCDMTDDDATAVCITIINYTLTMA